MKLPPDTTEEQRYQFEERAGIHEDSHVPRPQAEALAFREVFGIEPPQESVQAVML